jgi:hypothetical protein
MTHSKLIAALFLFGTLMAQGSPVQLVQGGWDLGGPLEIAFSGNDNDLDGWITQTELTEFQAVFTLPDGTLTAWLTPDLEPDGFYFADEGNFLLFATNANYTLVDISFEGEALATVFDENLFPVVNSEASPTAVPEPGSMALFGLGGALMWWGRYKRR